MRPWRTGIVALIASVGIMTLAFGCGHQTTPTPAPASSVASRPATAPLAGSLGAVEIRRYEGKPLDPVGAEPETSINGPQHVKIADYHLSVGGLVRTPLSMTYQQVLALPAYQKRTTLQCIDGWSVTYLWQGILLKDLLERAGYDPSARTVIFRCYDGYSTSLPLDFVVDRNILLAYGMNGIVMPAERGYPFQVVAEDRYGYKWAKWVTGIEVSDDIRFRGHFEKMGADNTAAVPAGK